MASRPISPIPLKSRLIQPFLRRFCGELLQSAAESAIVILGLVHPDEDFQCPASENHPNCGIKMDAS